MPSSSTDRSVLEDTTNEYRIPSPPHASAKKGPVLRRKLSHHALHPHLDSSESYPSPHDSIYEATVASASAENVGFYDAKDWKTPGQTEDVALTSLSREGPETQPSDNGPSWEHTVIDSSGNAVPAAFLQDSLSPDKHTPHKLYPITEQNSLATLRTGISLSTLKDKPSATTIRPISPGLKGKKQKSFSLSDLPPSRSPLPSKRTPSPTSSPQSFYTPIEPHQPPPVRTPTPPGLPTFNEPAAFNYRLPPPTTRLRDKFRPPTAAEREWAMQTVGLPRGVVMRGEGGVLVRGKFTPIRSGHFPPQRQAHTLFRLPDPGRDSHPLEATSAPRPVRLDRRHVQFTGPRAEPVGTTGEGEVPATVINENEGRRRKDEKAERFFRGLYWALGCCGLCEAWDLSSEEKRRRSESRVAGDRPLFVGGFNARQQRAVS
ncbi:hypothetical protein ACLMJK_005489 [Lecanora helva]